jgi:YD repeat-containing protein
LASKTLPGGFTTSISYQYVSNGSLADVHNQKTTINPDGGTVVEYTLRDGRKSSVTGTAVADVTYDYEYDASGYLNTTETLSSGAWTKTITDWNGRADRVVSPTFDGGANREIINRYNGLGQLTAQDTMSGSTKLVPTQLFSYDTFGRLQYEATDSNNNDQIDFSQDLNAKQHLWDYEKLQTGVVSQTEWYLFQTELIWPYDQDDEGGAADRSGDWRSAWQTYTQVSGFTDSVASHVVSADFDRNWTVAHTFIDRADRNTESFVDTAGTSETIREVYRNGMLVESENAQGHVGRQSYDGLGRLLKVMDPRIGAADPQNGWSTYSYDADTA